MMVYALSVALDLVFVHPAKNLLDLVLFGTLMTFLLVIVVRQTGSTLPAASRRTNWVALLYNSVAFMIMMYAYSIAVAFQAQKDPSSVILFGMSNPGTMPQWYVYLSAGLMVVNAFIALFGLAALRGYTVVTRTEDEDADDST
jgi:Ni/Fe-hydrogenase subunit HybB-like protein